MIECDFCNRPAEAYVEIDGEQILLCGSDECVEKLKGMESKALDVDSDVFLTKPR